jgi:hypothetical protein
LFTLGSFSKMAEVAHFEGDQIGRIFADWLFTLPAILKITEVAPH